MGKIKNMKKLWGKSRDKAGTALGDFIPVDVGTYNMQLIKAEANDYGDARKVRLWWVVCGGDDDGAICQDFSQIDDEDRLVWVIRDLQKMGVEVDDLDIDDEDDLMKVYDDLIAEMTVCSVSVTEKNGYTNMKIKKAVEIDEDDLKDPEEVMKNDGSNGGGGKKKDDDDDDDGDDEDEFEEGDVVTFKKGKKTLEGTITGFTDDDEAKVKVGKKSHVVDLDDLELVEGDEDEDDDAEEEEKPSKKSKSDKKKSKSKKDEDEDDDDDDEDDDDSDDEDDDDDSDSDDGDFDAASAKKGDKVEANYDGDWFSGVIVKNNVKKKTATVKFDEDGEEDAVKHADLRAAGGGDDEDDDAEEEVKKGDKVVVGKKKGKVVSVKGDKVKVKLDKGGKTVTVDSDEVKFQ